MEYGTVRFHQLLVNDTRRNQTYREAIHQAVRPGDTVLDIGTGSGILAFFACEAGASRVWAVDKTGVLDMATRMAKENGFDHKIQFIHGDIRSVSLPGKADVIVSELISKSLIGQRMEELVEYCRLHFLKPGGRLVPQSVKLRVGPVEVPKIWNERLALPQKESSGLSFAPMRELLANTVTSARIPPEALLDEPQDAYLLDSHTTTRDQHPDASLSFTAQRDATLHGFASWFSASLTDSVELSNQPPGLPSWDNALFCLPEPVQVLEGSHITIELKGFHPPGTPVIWQWRTRVWGADDSTGAATPRVSFSQSTFDSMLFAKRDLVHASRSSRPELSPDGAKLSQILKLCNEGLTVEEIAARLAQDHDRDFPSLDTAQHFVRSALDGLAISGYLS